MDLVIQAKQRRLQKMHRTKELHGWIVHDPWIQNKVYKNLVSGEYKEVSYVTKDYYNPLPFHTNIEYVGIVHDNKIQYNDTIQKKFGLFGSDTQTQSKYVFLWVGDQAISNILLDQDKSIL